MFETTKGIDLSTPIRQGMATWASGPRPNLERTAWAAADGVTGTEITRFSMHTGTHVDAPAHFIPGGKWIDDYPIEKYMGTGVALDLRGLDPAQPIDREVLEPFGDVVEDGDVVMCHTGWSNRRGLTQEYLFEFPYLTADAGMFFRDHGVSAVGVDTLSVGGFDETLPNQGPVAGTPSEVSHVKLLEADILPIEVVNNLERVLDGRDHRRAFYHFAPIRFEDVEASPVRATAHVPM